MKNLLKLTVGVYMAVVPIAAFSCLMLPFETRGHELSDHRNQSSSAKSWHFLFKSKPEFQISAIEFLCICMGG